MTTKLRDVRSSVRALADPVRAAGVARFFKTGKGEYGEGDKFLGLYVPQITELARGAREISHDDTLKLLASPWHEERALALMILVDAHGRAGERDKSRIHRAYLANTAHVNNWDLVRNEFGPTLLIAERLLDDEQDLIHKAVGWMLREVGKRDVEVLRAFLRAHRTRMPRTALRYSIERLAPDERKRILAAVY